MGKLYEVMPLLSTDYSSAASSVMDTRGLAIICCPNGCMGNYVRFDEPRWAETPGSVLQMDVCEKDVIFGGTDLLDDLSRLSDSDRPMFVALINTPVSSLVGFDTKAIASHITNELDIPAVSIDTDGYGDHHEGIRKSMMSMLDIVPEGEPYGDVAILGFNSLEYTESDLDLIVDDIIKREDTHPLLFPGTALRGLTGLRNVRKNIVISSSAVPFARHMERVYGIPYEHYRMRESTTFITGCRTLIVGEQVRSNIIRDILKRNGSDADIISLYNLDDRYAGSGDVCITDEEELRKAFNRGYQRIIADPLLKRLAPEGIEFIQDPQPSISSRLFWKDRIPLEMLESRFNL